MRKLMNIFAAALVMLAAVGCEKNETLPDNSSKVVTLSATINNGGTKTSLGALENGEYPVLWSEGDAIAIIQNGTKYEFTLSEGEGTTVAKFTSAAADGFNSSEAFVAYYPCDAVTVNGSTITCTISAVQTYAANSFGQGTMPMAGYAANASGVVSFENLFGVVKLQLKGVADEKVESIEITSGNCISGAAALIITESAKSISLSSEDAVAKKVVLDCGTDGVALNATTATDFLIAVPAGVAGLKVLINTTKDAYYKEIPTQAENTITAGKILKMPELTTTDMAPAYIENGVCYGGGIALPKSATETLIWAPVNCGYEPANGEYKGYPYGKLYQWGRKYGQGYTTDYDATVPEVVAGPVALEVGQNPENANKSYKNTSSPYDWVSSQGNTLWNSGSADAPVRTEYDPCPAGWRVPTNEELISLVSGLTEGLNGSVSTSGQWTGSSEDSNHNGLPGLWFYGSTTPSEDGTKVFFPAAGNSDYSNGAAGDRSYSGNYWSSSVKGTYAWYLHFNKNERIILTSNPRAGGCSVRCVKDLQVQSTE